MKRLLLLVLSLYFCSLTIDVNAQGQLSKEASAKIVRGILREKMRPGIFRDGHLLRQLPRELRREATNIYGENRTNSTEVVISASTESESEIHAAINPVDSSSWVCSSNAVDPNGGTTNDVPVNHIYYTTDFGSTWTRSAFDPLPVVSGVTIAGGGDPNFAFDKNGRVYTSWINLYLQGFTSVSWQLLWAYSDDGGITWQRGSSPDIISTSGPITALFDPTLFNGPIADKEWLAVDRSSSSYQNNLYCAYYEAGGPSNLNTIAVRKKDAAANTFSSSVYVTDNTFMFVQFSSIDVDGSGNVHVGFFGSTDSINYAFYHSMSVDGGATFSAPNKISDVQLPNYSPGQSGQTITGIDVQRMYPSCYLAADKTTGTTTSGNVYATWTANGVLAQGNTGSDVYYSRSTDGGTTWSAAIPLNNTTAADPTDQFYPSLCVSPAGTVVVSWYDRRNNPGTALTDYFIAWSTDGGVTFNNDLPASNASTDFTTIGSVNSNFGIGEYNAVMATQDYAIPVWGDGRTNDGDLNLYTAIIPFSSNVGIPGISPNSTLYLLSISPNPASSGGEVRLSSSSSEIISLELYDNHGRFLRMIYKGELMGEKSVGLPVDQLSNGTYTLVLRTGKSMTSGSFVVSK